MTRDNRSTCRFPSANASVQSALICVRDSFPYTLLTQSAVNLRTFAACHDAHHTELLIVQQPSDDPRSWERTAETVQQMLLQRRGRGGGDDIVHSMSLVWASDAADDMIRSFKISKQVEKLQAKQAALSERDRQTQPAAVIHEFASLCKHLTAEQAHTASQCFPTICDLFLQEPALIQQLVDNRRIEAQAALTLARLTVKDHVV